MLAHFHDLALQPRTTYRWTVHRLASARSGGNGGGGRGLATEEERHRTAHALTKHLVRTWRITKPENRDVTRAVVRQLATTECEEVDVELGMFVALECTVAVDHAPADELLGPKASKADVVLCMGRPAPHGADGDADTVAFSFALTRGKLDIVKSVLDFLRSACDLDASAVRVAPVHMAFLAHEWTRVNIDPHEKWGTSATNRTRGVRPAERKLSLAYTLPVNGTDVQTVTVDVPLPSLTALHDLTSRRKRARTTGDVDVDEEAEEDGDDDGDAQAAREEENDDNDRYPASVRALAAHLSKHLGIDLNGAAISGVVTPAAELDAAGHVRFFWPPLLKSALYHLDRVTSAAAVVSSSSSSS